MYFPLLISKTKSNLEIVAKILNSIAINYDCRIKYNKSSQTIRFYGNTSYQRQIVEDCLSFFPNIQGDLLDTVQYSPTQKQINPIELYEKRDLIIKIEDLLSLSEYLSQNLVAALNNTRNMLICDLEGSFLLPKSFSIEHHSRSSCRRRGDS